MTTPHKVIVALDDPSPDARSAFVDWTRRLARDGAVVRAEIETVAPDAHRAHTRKAVRWSAFASLWVEGAGIDGIVDARPAGTNWFRVRERLAFDRSARADEARPWSGVKKTTPWAPVDGVDRQVWQARYTNHGVLAHAYHATAVRYRQNVVLASDVPGIGGISELWWTDVEDLVERFYASHEAQRLVGYDTIGFVDAARAHPVVTTHETLRAAEVTTSLGFLPDHEG